MGNFNEFDTNANSPSQETGNIISHAFENYKTVIGWAVLALVLAAIASSILSFIVEKLVGYNNLEAQMMMTDAIKSGDYSDILQIPGFVSNMSISFFVGTLLYPLYIGVLQILNKANYKKKVEFSDLFIGYKQNTGNIILYLLITNITMTIAFAMCFLPAIFIAPFFFLGLPIVFFENQSVGAALSKSFNLGSQNYGTLLGASFLGGLISFCGVFLCGIGIIFTAFFFLATMYSAYCAFCGAPRQLEQIKYQK